MAFKTYAGGAGALALLAALAGAHPRTGDAAHALAALMGAAAPAPRADFDTDALTGLGIASLSVLADVAEHEARRTLGVERLRGYAGSDWHTRGGDERARIARHRRASA